MQINANKCAFPGINYVCNLKHKRNVNPSCLDDYNITGFEKGDEKYSCKTEYSI